MDIVLSKLGLLYNICYVYLISLCWKGVNVYINEVKIKNYRCFEKFITKLNPFTLIIGENNSGKTNFLKALSLPLTMGNLDFSQKRLVIADFNSVSVENCLKQAFNYYRLTAEEQREEKNFNPLIDSIPIIEVEVNFCCPQNSYEVALINSFLTEKDQKPAFTIKYIYEPKDSNILERIKELVLSIDKIEDLKWQLFPIDTYEYDIVTTSNDKSVSYEKLKNLVANIIGAERDDFSDSPAMRSNNILTKLLINELSTKEKEIINLAYNDFFTKVESAGTFQRLLNSDAAFDNIKEHLKDIGCIPNLPNLKNILSNITLSYGNEFLYQKGLGERNLVFIFLFFTYFKKNNSEFNLCCVEEPEAHLGVNKLRLTIDFLEKSVNESNTLLQTIVTTHNPAIINKLKISNVVAFSGNKAVSLSSFGEELNDYLRKRPNFDILRLIYADKLILVEGPSEEMLIRTHIHLNQDNLYDVEVISVNQKGYRSFLDIWLLVNAHNHNKKIAVIRDFDDQENAQKEHELYKGKHPHITVETTVCYTLEDDLVHHGNNIHNIAESFKIALDDDDSSDGEIISMFLKDDKTGGMLTLCDAMLSNENPLIIELPPHINNVLGAMQ